MVKVEGDVVRVCASDALQPNTTKRRVWFTTWAKFIEFVRRPDSSDQLIKAGYRIVMCVSQVGCAIWTSTTGWEIHFLDD